MLDDIFRRADDDQPAPFVARFGAHVDDPVGRLDHVQVVLDHHDRVAQVDQAVEHVEQLGQVVEVQAGGRLVEQVERAAGVGARQLGRQLDALGLAAGERRRRLAEREVVEPHVAQRLQDAANLGDVLEQLAPPRRTTCPARRRSTGRGTARPASRGCSAGPRHVSHSTHTSGRKCISIRFWPFPSHASQRPPGTLKLNRRGV